MSSNHIYPVLCKAWMWCECLLRHAGWPGIKALRLSRDSYGASRGFAFLVCCTLYPHLASRDHAAADAIAAAIQLRTMISTVCLLSWFFSPYQSIFCRKGSMHGDCWTQTTEDKMGSILLCSNM